MMIYPRSIGIHYLLAASVLLAFASQADATGPTVWERVRPALSLRRTQHNAQHNDQLNDQQTAPLINNARPIRASTISRADSISSIGSTTSVSSLQSSTTVDPAQFKVKKTAWGGVVVSDNNANVNYPPMVPNTITGVETLKAHGLTGKDVRIGIVSSGVDYRHPALGGKFGKGYKVAYGYDYVGDKYTEGGIAFAKADPLDCAGFGTTAAGIIAGSTNQFKGVAHKATLGAYRVISCYRNKVEYKHVKEAFAQANSDKMHIILNTFAVPSENAAQFASLFEMYHRMNIIIITPLGDPSSDGILAWTPIASPHVITVGNADVEYTKQAYFMIKETEKETPIPYSLACSTRKLLPRKIELMSVTLDPRDCVFPKYVKKSGVFIYNNGCDINKLIVEAKNANAAMLFMGGLENHANNCLVPIISLNAFAYNKLERISRRYTHLNLEFPHGKMLAPSADLKLKSSTTRWGPGLDLKMSPDVIAPGTLMFTTSKWDQTRYEIAAGASCAAAYVAGSTALFLHRQAELARSGVARYQPAVFKAHLRRSATPYMMENMPVIAPVPQQGAGMIRIDRVLEQPTFTVSPTSIELGDRPKTTKTTYEKKASITIANSDRNARVYTITMMHSASMQAFDKLGDKLDRQKLTMTPVDAEAYEQTILRKKTFFRKAKVESKLISEVRVEPGTSRQVPIKFTIPSTLTFANHWLYSGYIVIDPNHTEGQLPSNEAIYVPYLGLNGKLRSIQKLAKQEMLARHVMNSLNIVYKNMVFIHSLQSREGQSEVQVQIKQSVSAMKGRVKDIEMMLSEIKKTRKDVAHAFKLSSRGYQPRLLKRLQGYFKDILYNTNVQPLTSVAHIAKYRAKLTKMLKSLDKHVNE